MLVGLYWHIGKRIRDDILREQRAVYGEQIVQALSAQLTVEYGRGFGRRNLFQMIRFAEFFPDEKIVQTLSAQLGWSHFVELISIEDALKRDFKTLHESIRRRRSAWPLRSRIVMLKTNRPYHR